jgi:hypothetical protein
MVSEIDLDTPKCKIVPHMGIEGKNREGVI